MPHLIIKLDVDRRGFDALSGMGTAADGIADGKVIHLGNDAEIEVGTLRHGTTGGKDSVAICFTLPDGKVVLAETTADSLASFDRATSSWRTSQLSLLEEWDAFSETWPRSGMTRSGTAYRLRPSAPLTKEIGSGSWPTPRVASDRTSRASLLRKGHWSAPGLAQAVEIVAGILPREYDSWDQVPAGALSLQKIPTPTARNGASSRNTTAGRSSWDGVHLGDTLTDFVTKWPTPTASDGMGGPGNSGREGGDNLRTAVARAHRPAPGLRTGGQLNPTWVEWLMGFPLGWTDLGASATRSSRRSRSGSAGA